MRLSDTDIQRALHDGSIQISPSPGEKQRGSFSIDLRISNQFTLFDARIPHEILLTDKGPTHPPPTTLSTISEGETFWMMPGDFALGVTMETITLPDNIVGWIDGRSSLARVGLMVHATAHAVDPGWHGQITFELFNAGPFPIQIAPGTRIADISLEQLTSPSSRPYRAKTDPSFINQTRPGVTRDQAK